MTEVIDRFKGDYEFLSNFYECWSIQSGEFLFPTLEHAFQCAKTHDRGWKTRILRAASPGAAKGLGRAAPLRHDWEGVKYHVMRKLVGEKFAHPPLRTMLVKTIGTVLIEGNHWGDTYWGVDVRKGGKNRLGLILMDVRSCYTGEEVPWDLWGEFP